MAEVAFELKRYNGQFVTRIIDFVDKSLKLGPFFVPLFQFIVFADKCLSFVLFKLMTLLMKAYSVERKSTLYNCTPFPLTNSVHFDTAVLPADFGVEIGIIGIEFGDKPDNFVLKTYFRADFERRKTIKKSTFLPSFRKIRYGGEKR